MKFKDAFWKAYKGMGRSISRYPLTVLFLIAVAVLNSFMIENPREDYARYLFTFLVGAMLSIVGQMVYERFFTQLNARYLLMGGAVLLTTGYYFAVGPQTQYNIAINVKTGVALFALMIAFIWIPSIKSVKVPFHRSFLSALKAFFTTVLFTGVLAGGISAIFYATDYLLFNLDFKILTHLLNIVGSLFAPIYFLSMTPLYPGKREELIPDEAWAKRGETLDRQFMVPRFLEILISYIIIPLTAIYTLILVIYVVMNIRGEFWTDNLMEPLLVSYAIIVIIVYILACNLENKFADLFRKIFPKILIPIVVFQTVASFLKIREMGVTHGRYYVILFGIFATIAGVIFSFMKPKHNGLIAIALLVLSAISIIPPIDAFTVSKNNQIGFLEQKLLENDMLVDNAIVPKSDVSIDDKIVITKVASYIDNMGYNKEVAYLPSDFNVYSDFSDTYGFDMTYSETEYPQGEGEFVYLNWDADPVVGIANFDVMIHQYLYYSEVETSPVETTDFEVNGQPYQLEKRLDGTYYVLTVKDATGEKLIVYNTREVYDAIFEEAATSGFDKGNLTIEDATVTTENDQIRMNILVNSLERTPDFTGGDLYIFMEFK
ncbi:DUF4153 domain-containing protein [Trichococcus collinsii]|uniref:DUF4153 domain-containing protein n=1 Tax=Trichococcus collinsii TaxID=157076 RepID=A0AB38A267_9LACT|nr:DUF4153 domain-containing protein [Trichococcus collinsii]CZQ96443.1 Hypothetical protein Tcol_1428 [Trichococcus collinsii]SEA69214.1 protein of unknown function [Trichococcus collinsii]